VDPGELDRARMMRVVRANSGESLFKAGASMLGPIGGIATDLRSAITAREFVEEAIVEAAIAAHDFQHALLLAQGVGLENLLYGQDETLTIDSLPAKSAEGRLANPNQATQGWLQVRDDLLEARIVFRRECGAASDLPPPARRAVRQISQAAVTLLGCANELAGIWSQVGTYTMSGDPGGHLESLRFDREAPHARITGAVQDIQRAVDDLVELARREAPELWAQAQPEVPTAASEAQRSRRALKELADIAADVLRDGFSREWLAYSPLGAQLDTVDLAAVADCEDLDFIEPHRQNGWLSSGNELEGAVARFTHRSELKRDRVDADIWRLVESITIALKRSSSAALDVWTRVRVLAGASDGDRARLQVEIDDAKSRYHEHLKIAVRAIHAIRKRNDEA
jgi:hypothetical protein